MPSFSIWKILSLLFMLRYSVASGFDSHDGASAFSFSVSPPDDGSSGNPIVAPPTGDSYSTGESQGSLIGAGCQDDAYQIPNGKRGIRRRGKSCPANFNVQDPAKDQGTTSPNGQQQPDSGTGEQQITPSPFNQKSTDTVPSLPAPPQSNQKMCHDPSLSIPLCSLAVNAINVPLGSPYFTLPICSPPIPTSGCFQGEILYCCAATTASSKVSDGIQGIVCVPEDRVIELQQIPFW